MCDLIHAYTMKKKIKRNTFKLTLALSTRVCVMFERMRSLLNVRRESFFGSLFIHVCVCVCVYRIRILTLLNSCIIIFKFSRPTIADLHVMHGGEWYYVFVRWFALPVQIFLSLAVPRYFSTPLVDIRNCRHNRSRDFFFRFFLYNFFFFFLFNTSRQFI